MEEKSIPQTMVFISAVTNSDFVDQNSDILMSMDIWDAKLFPEPVGVKDYVKNYDFSEIVQETIKHEAKLFIIYEFRRGMKMKTVQKTLLNIVRLSQFIAYDQPYAESIYDLPDGFDKKIKETDPFFADKSYALGRVKSAYKAFRKHIADLWDTTGNEFKRDRIRLDSLDFGVNQNDAVRRNSITLSSIKQDWLRQIMEQYIPIRLKYKSVSTVVSDIRSATLISKALDSSGSMITSIDELTEMDAMNIMSYIGSQGFKPRTYNSYINGVKNLLRDLYDNDFCDKNGAERFTLFRPANIVKKAPEVYSDREMGLIFKAISKLPSQYQQVMLILISTGWRASDVLNITCDKPLVEIDGKLFLQAIQKKTKEIVTMPCLDETVPDVITMAVTDSQAEYGINCKYAFARSASLPLAYSTVRDKLITALKDMNALDDKGKPFRPKLHGFRRTRVTDLVVNCGIPPEIAARIIGHKGVRSLMPYSEISDAQFAEAVQPMHNDLDDMIRNRGYKNSNEDMDSQVYLPLIDGACARPLEAGFCEKLGNDCYLCRMFRAQRVFLPYYKRLYMSYMRTWSYAKENGIRLLAEKCYGMGRALENIIHALEDADEQD